MDLPFPFHMMVFIGQLLYCSS